MRIAPFKPWLTLIPPVENDQDAPNGVRVKFAPPTKPMRMAAARAAQKALARLGLDPAELGGRELDEDEMIAVFEASDEASRALIRLGVLSAEVPEWEGMLDLDGKPLQLDAETLEWALLNDEFFSAADALYVQPAAAKDREKNGSSASSNGIGEAGTTGSDTASSAAKASGTGAVRSARTKAAGRKPRKAKASGTS